MKAPCRYSVVYFLLMACSVCAAQSSRNARVTVEVWTQADEQIHDASVTLVELGTQKSIGSFRNGRAESIPFGHYALHVRRPGFKWFERRVHIEHSDVFVRAVLSVELPLKPCTLKGRLTIGTADWIKLVPIFDSVGTTVEAKVKDDGTFVVGGIENGDYVLVALQGLRPVLIRQLHIWGDIDVELEPPRVAQ